MVIKWLDGKQQSRWNVFSVLLPFSVPSLPELLLHSLPSSTFPCQGLKGTYPVQSSYSGWLWPGHPWCSWHRPSNPRTNIRPWAWFGVRAHQAGASLVAAGHFQDTKCFFLLRDDGPSLLLDEFLLSYNFPMDINSWVWYILKNKSA